MYMTAEGATSRRRYRFVSAPGGAKAGARRWPHEDAAACLGSGVGIPLSQPAEGHTVIVGCAYPPRRGAIHVRWNLARDTGISIQ